MVPFHHLLTQIGKDKVGCRTESRDWGGELQFTPSSPELGCNGDLRGCPVSPLPIQTQGDKVGMQSWEWGICGGSYLTFPHLNWGAQGGAGGLGVGIWRGPEWEFGEVPSHLSTPELGEDRVGLEGWEWEFGGMGMGIWRDPISPFYT